MKTLCLIGSMTAVLMTGGCAVATHENMAAFLKAHENKVALTELRVGAADTIDIVAPKILEIDGERMTIQPDGKVSLRLVGDVRVVGLTTREIANKLEELLSPYYREPKVDVRIVHQPQRVYYVLGQVGGAGPFQCSGHDTLMNALVLATPTNIAWKTKVKVIRPSPDESQRREIEVDVEKMIETGDTRMNILLEPGDVVYVPPTPLGAIGLKLQELLFPVRPMLDTATAPRAFADIPDYYREDRNVTRVTSFR